MAPADPITDLETLPAVLKIPEVAAVLRASESGVRALIREGRIGSVRLGRMIRVPRHELARFLAGNGSSR